MSDVHSHYCTSCRAPWSHDGDKLETNPQIRAGHHCPSCGTAGWSKYYGNETHDEMVELERLLAASEDPNLSEYDRERAEMDFARMARRLHRPNSPVPGDREGVREDDGLTERQARALLNLARLLKGLAPRSDFCDSDSTDRVFR